MDETIFVCPACKAALVRNGGACACVNGHSYDIAKQGYLHLVMPNKIHSKAPGDTKEMVLARREFLNKGYYDIFCDKLCEIILHYNFPVILDAGCGEGYYTAAIKNISPESSVFGFDISKAAVRAAAGKYKNIKFAVASIFDIPVGNSFCDCLINVFAPIVENEFLRVLKKDGILIIAVPGKRHLIEMKNILYEAPYENEEKETLYKGFEPIGRFPVTGRISLPDNQTIWQLFSMTPYYWKTGIEGSERLKETEILTTEIEFDFLIYKKI